MLLINSLTVFVGLLLSSVTPSHGFGVVPRFGHGRVATMSSSRIYPAFVMSDEDIMEETPLVAEEEVVATDTAAADIKSEDPSLAEPARYTVFAGNLPLDDCSVESVTALFEPVGKVEYVSVPINRNTNEPRGFAFVDMATPEDVQTAIRELDGTEYGGRTLRVNESLPKDQVKKKERAAPRQELEEGLKKLYLGNLPFDCTKEELMDFLEPFGTPLEVYLPLNMDTGAGRGFGFATMKEEDAERALEEANGLDFGGRRIVVNEPLPPGEKSNRRASGGRAKLYVGNLSFYTVRETLEDIFAEFGTVYDCYLPEDQATGSTRGFGFVTMAPDAAERCVDELDGCEVDGRAIRVNFAQPK